MCFINLSNVCVAVFTCNVYMDRDLGIKFDFSQYRLTFGFKIGLFTNKCYC